MRHKNLLELEAKLTAKSIIGRRVYSIKCCDTWMAQIDVRARYVLGQSTSVITLLCPSCDRELKVELTNFKATDKALWESLQEENPDDLQ